MDNKSKQIAYLAFFKALVSRDTLTMEEVQTKSGELVEYLDEKYPLYNPSENPFDKTGNWKFDNQPKKQSGTKQKPAKCPNCGSMSYYHNTGIGKTGKPYENYKCSKCKHIEWIDNKQEVAQSRAEDSIWDEASHNSAEEEYYQGN